MTPTDTILAALRTTLLEGGAVAFPGFGTLATVKTREYIGIDTATGERTLYPPHVEVRFTPSRLLHKHLR